MSKILFQGAEAIITKQKSNFVKNRVPKEYRISEIDNKLRKIRTRKEIKLLEKAGKLIKVPKVVSFSDYTITLEEIKGKKLAENLEKLSNIYNISKEIGKSLSKLHEAGIIHGDLTTSNLIKAKNGVYFIDFGLGYESDSPEDKAVDLHVLKEALTAKHPKIAAKFFNSILVSYKTKDNEKILERLEIVEKRGRYKQQF